MLYDLYNISHVYYYAQVYYTCTYINRGAYYNYYEG
jgi:hypothetical protein